ncbi:MAG: cupin domain-containing protein [Magnetococcales bacterium]|nr:cupin domain-containing protein [Magnetococcales bacterium]
MKTSYRNVTAYVTKDGSEIRELLHPGVQKAGRQSLAEAIIQPGSRTRLHYHQTTEELYHVTQGFGSMILGQQTIAIEPGDTVLIPPKMPHCVEAYGTVPLHILCCCHPAYSHEDTELME